MQGNLALVEVALMMPTTERDSHSVWRLAVATPPHDAVMRRGEAELLHPVFLAYAAWQAAHSVQVCWIVPAVALGAVGGVFLVYGAARQVHFSPPTSPSHPVCSIFGVTASDAGSP